MITELKAKVILDVEKIASKLTYGYSVDFTDIVNQI
jgi:hypothetical protein